MHVVFFRKIVLFLFLKAQKKIAVLWLHLSIIDGSCLLQKYNILCCYSRGRAISIAFLVMICSILIFAFGSSKQNVIKALEMQVVKSCDQLVQIQVNNFG